jgi:hypothetical protein
MELGLSPSEIKPTRRGRQPRTTNAACRRHPTAPTEAIERYTLQISHFRSSRKSPPAAATRSAHSHGDA